MAESDAELYLRLAGERALLDPGADGNPAENAALDAAAHALAAVRAMTAAAAQAIVDDYDLACGYRTGEQHRQHRALRRAVRKAAPPGPALPALRAVPCDHPDLEGEQILGALAGQRSACLDALDAWAGHADDLRVLVVASRGAADPVRVRPEDVAYVAPSVMGRGPAVMARRRAAVTAMMIGGRSRERGDTLATLLSLGGPMQARLTATVAAAWRERLRDGAAPADTAAAQAARPALHSALYGRVVATLRAWTGQPDLRVTLTMIPEAAPPALARDGDGIAVELPFGWISDVWARGLGTCWDRFCLAAGPARDGWELSTAGPDLGAPEPIMISGSAVG